MMAALAEIDRFFDEHALDGHPVPDGLLAEGFGQRIFALGGNVGEVLRRGMGGRRDVAAAVLVDLGVVPSR